MSVRVQTAAFDPGQLLSAVHAAAGTGAGAVVSFVGYVRDLNEESIVQGMFLEHFPGMTEKSLAAIETQARQRWPLQAVEIVHRVGQLKPAEPIVFVGVGSVHRQAAFDACNFIMDYLKTRAPFWKKEETASGARWLDGRDSDRLAARRWEQE